MKQFLKYIKGYKASKKTYIFTGAFIVTGAVFYAIAASAAQFTISTGTNNSVVGQDGANPATVFISDQVGYAFMRYGVGVCSYSKTTNGGSSWGSVVQVTGGCQHIAVWYDRWTPGDTGNYIHVAATTSAGSIIYNRLDTSNDSLLLTGTTTTLIETSVTNTPTVNGNWPSISKSTDGYVYAGINDAGVAGDTGWVFRCPNSCSSNTWSDTSIALPNTSERDAIALTPLFEADMLVVIRDITNGDIQSKVFHSSNTTWDASWYTVDASAASITTYGGAGVSAATDYTTGDVYISYTADNNTLGTNDDVRTAMYSNGTWHLRADVITNTASGVIGTALGYVPATGEVYVAYSMRSTPATTTTVDVFYKKSSDGMASWGTQQGPLNSAQAEITGVRINAVNNYRMMITWHVAASTTMYGDIVADITPPVMTQESYRLFTNANTSNSVLPASVTRKWSGDSTGGTDNTFSSQATYMVPDVLGFSPPGLINSAQSLANSFTTWTSIGGYTQHSWAADFRMESLPPILTTIVYPLTTTSSRTYQIQLTTAGDLRIYDSAATLQVTAPIKLGTGVNYRIEAIETSTAMTVRVFFSGTNKLVTEVSTSAGSYGNLDSFRFGVIGTTTNNWPVYWDNILVSDTASFIGDVEQYQEVNTGSSLAAQDTAATGVVVDEPFRLRLNVGVQTTGLSSYVAPLKLQYKEQVSGPCTTTGTFYDISTSTPIRYYDNAGLKEGNSLTSTDNPTRGGVTAIKQEYTESGSLTVKKAVATGEDGIWDIALSSQSGVEGKTFCLRATLADGTVLDNYDVLPEISFAGAATVTQESYRWFANSTSYRQTAAYVNSSQATSAGDDLSASVPSGTQNGDLIVCSLVYNSTNETITMPSGWTSILNPTIYGSAYFSMVYRFRTTGVNTVAWSVTNGDATTGKSTVSCLSYRNVESLQVGVFRSRIGVASTDQIANGITTGATSQRVAGFFMEKSTSTTATAPGSMTSRGFATNGGGGSTSTLIADEVVSAAGATGTRTAVFDVSDNFGLAVLVEIIGSGEVGSSLAATDTPVGNVANSTPFRLRLNLGASSARLASATPFKLQYKAQSGGVCTSSGTYYDIDSSTTPIRYADNTDIINGSAYLSSANDPSRGGVTVNRQRYVESSLFTSRIMTPAGEDGLWDISLTSTTETRGITYCIRAVYGGGATLASYDAIPQITFDAGVPTLSQQLRGGQGVINGYNTPLVF